ncbi:MAG TPA: DUF433 domain-containing protein [Blastocatellia bacterium]|nr:DUF433 domain-containing protein [Blastocatellia bacterium]
MSQEEFQVDVAKGIVRRRDRGLCVKGNRITLYLIKDFLNDGWPPHLVQDQLLLTEEEMQNVLDYIATNRESFETEYAEVVQQAAERERYWRARQEALQKRLDERPGPPPNLSPEQAAAWARLAALRKKRKEEAA